MTERQMLVDQIIAHEGLRLKPYTDTAGKITIGVGRNLTDCGISDAEAMVLLDHDLDAAVADCATFPWFAGLDGIRQRVIVDLRFNLGPVKLRQFQQTLAAVAAGDYVKASDLMLKSKWARQVPTRAQRLARMMATGLALLFLLVAPASAQTDVVAHVKADLQASAYPSPPPRLDLMRALFSPIQQEPQHLPSHRMGPHEGEEGAWCYKGDTMHTGARTLYTCPCKLVCEGMDVREQDDCETSCSPKGAQCLCHADEACDGPDLEPQR